MLPQRCESGNAKAASNRDPGRSSHYGGLKGAPTSRHRKDSVVAMAMNDTRPPAAGTTKPTGYAVLILTGHPVHSWRYTTSVIHSFAMPKSYNMSLVDGWHGEQQVLHWHLIAT